MNDDKSTVQDRQWARVVWAVRAWLARGLPLVAQREEVLHLTGARPTVERLHWEPEDATGETWQRLAWLAIGWDPEAWRGHAWCSAWAALCDNQATGGPGLDYSHSCASSVTRRMGRGPAGRMPGVPGDKRATWDTTAEGDIVSVMWTNNGQAQGRHVGIVAKMGRSGICLVSGNGSGRLATGRPAHGNVVATFYDWGAVCHVLTPTDDVYRGPVRVPSGPKEVADWTARFDAVAGPLGVLP